MNMLLHGVDRRLNTGTAVENNDSEKYTLVCNFRCKGSLDYESVSADLLKSMQDKEDGTAVSWNVFIRMLKNGGRAAVIVPDGVLFKQQSP